MFQYIHKLLLKTPEQYKAPGGSTTPDPSHLYEVRDPISEDVNLLAKHEKDEYHSLTVQLLYFSKRGRTDLQTSIVFHCTRIHQPDKDDDKKLARTIRYLDKSKSLPLILSIDKY